MFTRKSAIGAAIGCAVLTMTGCSENSPTAPGTSASFQARLTPAGNFQAAGLMVFDILKGEFVARVHATGLEPNQHIPQHIHLNPTCNPGGGVLINLDQNLTVAGEAPSTGPAFPRADANGVVRYEARRSLTDLLAAVKTHFPAAGVQTVDDMLAFLDLEDRNGHMHVASGPPFPAVNCGELEPINY